MTVADFNADGALEFAVASNTETDIVSYVNTPFMKDGLGSAVGYSATVTAIADLDADGDIDVLPL